MKNDFTIYYNLLSRQHLSLVDITASIICLSHPIFLFKMPVVNQFCLLCE